jgi:hypothetical protein
MASEIGHAKMLDLKEVAFMKFFSPREIIEVAGK